MIIWVASYPKSGNTWVRSFLVSLIYKNKFKEFEGLKNIQQYPKRSHFKNLVKDFDNFEDISKNWIKSQDIINNDNKIKIIKTHHALCNFKGNFFTNYKNTLGVIYIVRDPRNVITSIYNHFSDDNYYNAKNFIIDENAIIGFNKHSSSDREPYDNEIHTIISSWKTHYKSWKLLNKNYLLVKYEDLNNNPEKEFLKISDYIGKFLNKKFDRNDIHKAIKDSSFEILKLKEEKFGFNEAPKNFKTGERIKFFNLGPNNNWKKILNKKIVEEINVKFELEMKELGYI